MTQPIGCLCNNCIFFLYELMLIQMTQSYCLAAYYCAYFLFIYVYLVCFCDSKILWYQFLIFGYFLLACHCFVAIVGFDYPFVFSAFNPPWVVNKCHLANNMTQPIECLCNNCIFFLYELMLIQMTQSYCLAAYYCAYFLFIYVYLVCFCDSKILWYQFLIFGYFLLACHCFVAIVGFDYPFVFAAFNSP